MRLPLQEPGGRSSTPVVCSAMDEVGRAYDDMAEPYIELVRTTEVHNDDLRLIERHLSTRPGTVLDAGCGPGHLADPGAR